MVGSRTTDVAVVGAGLAGLTAARAVAAAGYDVVVVEARGRVGGRTWNQELEGGKVVEAGGQWIGPTQDRMYQLASEMRLSTFPSYTQGDDVAVLSGRRLQYQGDLPRLNPLVMADLLQATFRFERLARTVPLDRPWSALRAARWDAMTFATWLQRSTVTKNARAILDAYMRAILATEAADVSLLHTLFYVHSGTSFQVLAAFEGGAQQDRFAGGSQRVAQSLAEQLGDAIQLEAPVRRLLQDATGVTVQTDRVTVRARRAVVAVPPALAARIDYQPPMPAERDQLTQRLPQGTVIKANVVYDEPFWRADGLSGTAFSPERLVTLSVDNSPPDGSPGVIGVFVEGNHARRLRRVDPATRRELVLGDLVDYLGLPAADPQAYLEVDWSAEVWTRGCYGAHFPPGVWTQHGPALREPIGLIHWAGTETATVWNGYMEGAVRSGDRVAGEVLARLG